MVHFRSPCFDVNGLKTNMSQWEGMYKKRDRYKEVMADYFKEEAKKDFRDMMSQMLSNPPPELMQQLASAMSVQQMTTQAP